MNIRARNILHGIVKKIIPGDGNVEIIVEIPGGMEIASLISREDAEKLDLSEDQTVFAVIDASDVKISVDWSADR